MHDTKYNYVIKNIEIAEYFNEIFDRLNKIDENIKEIKREIEKE